MSSLTTDPILLCYDRSDGARRAIEAAGALFPGRKAIVLHVWSPIAVVAAAYGGVLPIAAYDESELQSAARTLAEEGAAVAKAAGLDASAEIAESSYEGTWHAIVDAADKGGAGLIVLGARGLSTFKSLLLGSVSQGVTQHSHRAVLIVPPAGRAEGPSTG